MTRNSKIASACLLAVALAASAQNQPAWPTWAVPDVTALRLSPPPADPAPEIATLKILADQRDAGALRLIEYWNSGSPAYRWIQIAQREVNAHNLGGPAGTRAMALVAVALNDAMAAAFDSKFAYNRPRPTTVDPTFQAAIDVPATPSYPSEHAVAAAAAAAVLTYLFPDRAAAFDEMQGDAAVSRFYAGAEFQSDVQAGLTLGETVGAAVVAYARKDGSNAVFSGSFPAAPGKWSSANPVFPLAGAWRPWALDSGSQFRLPAPPAADSPDFKQLIDAVKNQPRTNATSHAAWFWQPSFIDPWIDSVNQLLFETRLDRDPVTSAAAYALLLVAQHDATIGCWDTKYAFLEERPIQVDSTIQTLFATPQHPGYPSGHACASGAAAGVLAALSPSNAAAYTARAREAGMSTFFAEIHTTLDVDRGLELGQGVAAAVLSRGNIQAILKIKTEKDTK